MREMEEVKAKGGDSAPNEKEYGVNWIVGHSNEARRWHFKLRWNWFASTDDIWKRVDGLLRTSITRNLKKRRKVECPPPEVLNRIVVGQHTETQVTSRGVRSSRRAFQLA